MGASQSLQASVGGGGELLNGCRLIQGAACDRTDHGEGVLDPVAQFLDEELLPLLRLLQVGHVQDHTVPDDRSVIASAWLADRTHPSAGTVASHRTGVEAVALHGAARPLGSDNV